jgi:hypothetical protein
MAEEQQQELREDSDRLIEALDDLKAMERAKRGVEISTPQFHGLADRIEDKSREVFRIAADERHIGESFDEAQGTTTEEVEPDRGGPE